MGLDLGTSGVKILVTDADGEVVATTTEEYPLYQPEVGWSEQNPAEWWDATVAGIEAVLDDPAVDPGEIEGLGLTGQMHGSVFLDGDHEVLRPAILWNDTRTSEQCAEIEERVGEDRIIELASNPPFEGFTAPKILWVQEHEPEVFERTEKILLPKDFIRLKLTGEFATDVSDASGTLLLNVGERDWSTEILETLDIPRELLPEVYESPKVTGEITDAVSERTGLPAGTPVVAGAGDNAAGAVGSGVVEDGDVWGSIGTSGVIFVATDEERTDPDGRVHTFCHAVPGKWHAMGVMLAAGGAFSWFADTLGGPEEVVADQLGTDTFDVLTDEATTVQPGSEGLIFLPYLNGERTPHRDADARGVFFGLSTRHEKAHIVRSVLEGVTYGLRDSLRIVRDDLGVDTGQLKAAGGGAKSPLWKQIQADIFDAEILTPNVDEGPAYGSALLAGVGAGVYDSVEGATERAVDIVDSVEPNGTHTQVYDEYYEIYESLYPALEDPFAANIQAIESAQDILETND
ncbi:xylulokinase [Halorhabdus amylolytica]|uniref:xylulokinase n=1 Tax=Halorhabdus amylolytica TaxID=2559573 RepID=UPI0010AAF366|nr:xylulokinase [Halorhabdus amylolytica]